MPEAADTDAGHAVALGRARARQAGGPRWAQVRAALAADRAHWRRRGTGAPRLRRGYHAVRLYRMSRYAHERGWRMAAWLLWLVNGWWTGADIPPSSRIAGGLFLPHPFGAIIAGAVGRDAAVGAQVVIGGLLKEPERDIGGGPGLPVLGDRVVLEPGALVLGAVHIGDGAWLGPRTIQRKDLAAGAVAIPQPPRPLPAEGPPASTAVGREPDGGADGRIRTGAAPCAASCAGPPHLHRLLAADFARILRQTTGGRPISRTRRLMHLSLPAMQVAVLHRCAHWLHWRGWPGPAGLVADLSLRLTGASLHPGSRIGPGLFVPHPVRVVFCGSAGRDLTLLPAALVGPSRWTLPTQPFPADAPWLGDGVVIGAHAALHGACRVGDGTIVGVGLALVRDARAGARDSAVPADSLSAPSAGPSAPGKAGA